MFSTNFWKKWEQMCANIGIPEQELEAVCQTKTSRLISIIEVSLSAQSIHGYNPWHWSHYHFCFYCLSPLTI